MAEKFWEVSGYGDLIPYDHDSTEEYFRASMNCGLLAVSEQEGQITGFIAGVAAPSMVNRNYLIGAELAWWVEPEYRKSGDGIRLIRHIETKAEDIGCKIWSMMSLEAQAPEEMENLYLKLGYTKAERTYVKVY